MTIKTAQQQMHDNLIVKMLAGSFAYGTNIETSDTDYRGIFVADPLNIRTPFYPIGEVEDSSEEDTKIYELNKFMKLALDCNPNIIELLWTREEDITVSTPAYALLRAHASDLLCSKIAFTTSGYAFGQLQRLKGHHKWINNAQSVAAPQQCDYVSLVHNFTGAKTFKFNLREYAYNYRLVPFSGNTYGVYQITGYCTFNETTGNLNDDYQGDSHELGTPLFIIKFNHGVYNAAKDMHSNYWTWKQNRNKVRSALEEKIGYDSKHAMHCVRLLRMGAETLETGRVNVFRPDAEELLSIRNGAWTYEELIEYAEKMDKYIKEVLYPKTKLPKKLNIKLASELILQIQDMVWSK